MVKVLWWAINSNFTGKIMKGLSKINKTNAVYLYAITFYKVLTKYIYQNYYTFYYIFEITSKSFVRK